VRDYLSIGCSPADEECAQVGTENYWVRSGRECHAFLHQLTRIFGLAPAGAYLSVKTFPHDFGEYREVVCYFDTDVEESQEYALGWRMRRRRNGTKRRVRNWRVPNART